MKNWKNWLLPILGTILLIMDMGFDAVNPLLIALQIPEKWVGVIKAVFGVYGLYRIARNKPITSKFGEGAGTPNKAP